MEEPFDDPATMTPSQRRREIATILARGALRLRQSASASPDRAARQDTEFQQSGLDEGAETSPHALAQLPSKRRP